MKERGGRRGKKKRKFCVLHRICQISRLELEHRICQISRVELEHRICQISRLELDSIGSGRIH